MCIDYDVDYPMLTTQCILSWEGWTDSINGVVC